jgi:F-type H+-transporting ATPase subunit delta
VPLNRSTARRYAEAAFEIATRDGSMAIWLAALDTAEERLGRDEVIGIMTNPAVSAADRIGLLDRLLAGDVSGPPRNLLALLVQRGRFDLLPDLIREFRRLNRRREGIVQATVTSAAPLDPAAVDAIVARLVDMTGQRVELSLAVDAGLLGGLQVRVGDRLIDASARGRLERLRATLSSSAI